MSNDIETKLSAARTKLIIDKPFLGALVLRLPLEAGDPNWCKTTATDARKLYYNPQYIEQLDLLQTQFALAHEALHCALSHFARRQHRDKHRWDLACDYAINPLLINDGLTPPPGALYDDCFEGMTAEEIYPSIQENSEEQPMDRHLYDEQNQADRGQGRDNEHTQAPPKQDSGTAQQSREKQQDASGKQDSSQTPSEPPSEQPQQGAPQPEPLTPQERENLSTQWQQRLAGAAQQAMQAGKLGGAMARLVDHMLEPQLPWRSLLAHYISSVARDDYTYARPSTRRGDPAVFPSLRSGQVSLMVALDTSGSISDEEISQFLNEIDAIKSQVRAQVTLHACDAALCEDGPWYYEPWEEFTLPRKFKGGGGTSFKPVFEWLELQDQQPDLVVYFTDAEGEFPQHEPQCPVLWLVKGRCKVPWGQRVQLN
ncbi:MAG: VWA-like domain-containing protein [Gammaproteobacteria bacterium]|jgi:predicted metal-dependent peptidase